LLACAWSGEGDGDSDDPGVGGAWMSGRRLEASPSPSSMSLDSATAWAGATLELRVRLGVRASAPRHENAMQSLKLAATTGWLRGLLQQKKEGKAHAGANLWRPCWEGEVGRGKRSHLAEASALLLIDAPAAFFFAGRQLSNAPPRPLPREPCVRESVCNCQVLCKEPLGEPLWH
jgi:hypothetical protein